MIAYLLVKDEFIPRYGHHLVLENIVGLYGEKENAEKQLSRLSDGNPYLKLLYEIIEIEIE